MKPHQSKFDRGRKIIVIFVALAILFGVLALMFTTENSRAQVIYVLAAFACIAGVIITSLTMCRCPYCGKRILNGVLVVKVCPKCKRSLSTGKKVKR